MIKLTKGAKPIVLVKNESAWTKILLDKITNDEEPTETERNRYRHPDIKAALLNETYAKCAYCESKLEHITYGDIEHIIPKSKAVEKSFQWDNLTLACDRCNSGKSDHEGLIDPYIHEPSEHVAFQGPILFPVGASALGRVSESILKLNRQPLVDKRTEKLRNINAQIANIALAQTAQLKQVLLDDLKNELKDSQEYAALARAFIPRALSNAGIT